MEFSIIQRVTFNASRGSYSPVTNRELYDSQITATDSEAKLLVEYFKSRGERIYVGNVNSNKEAARKQFRLFPTGDVINLNLVYPKPNKTELRLYLSSRAGFMPTKGDVWFLYVSNADHALWIGAMPESKWRDENDVVRIGEKESQKKKIQRDPALVRMRMELSRFSCEYNDAHKLFIAKSTGCRYVEIHHIIPLEFQREFAERNKKLDNINNLYSLCPYCHAAVHKAEGRVARALLSKMYDDRSVGFHYGISKLELFQYYSVEEIVKNVDPILSAIPEIEVNG